MIKAIKVFLAIVVVSLLTIRCTNTTSEGEKKIKITTTTSILADVVRNMVGDDVEVISLMGAGVDPHLYKASHGDINRLSSADVIVYNGLHLEGKMTDVFKKMGKKHKMIAFTEKLDKSQVLAIDKEAEVYDPHIWFSLSRWQECIKQTSIQLIDYLPERKDSIEINTKKYLTSLDSLDQWVRTRIAEVPEENRVLITSHDAFQYFGQEYGIRVKGLQGISTLAESGLRDVTEMVNFIIDDKVKAIFVENSVPQKALLSVQAGCKSKGHTVSIGGELFSDALGADRTPEGSYLGMIKYNVNTIVNALK
jgi:manganese/zinc/iron transport system substrate-binding protein